MTDYLPASFFLTIVTGAAGTAIAWAQLLAGSPSRYEHCGIVLNSSGLILEAEPGGARLGMLSQYEGRPLLISDAPVRTRLAKFDSLVDALGNAGHQLPPKASISSARLFGEVDVRKAVVAEARKLVGVPYSALDYAALAALHLHLPSAWIRRRVESSGHLICSALVDRVYANAGIHLFSDGRLPGDVLPADLAAYAEDHAS